MKTKLAVSLIAFAFAAAAATVDVTLPSKAVAGSTELKPGAYKVTVDGGKISFAQGKKIIAEAPVTTETVDKKYSQTSYSSVDSKIKELYLKGTTTKVIFGAAPAPDSSVHSTE